MWHLIYISDLMSKNLFGRVACTACAAGRGNTQPFQTPSETSSVQSLLHIIPLFSSCISFLHLRTALNILWDWGYVAHLKNVHNLQVVTYISDYFLLSGHHQSGWEDQIGRMIQSQLMNSISPTALCMGLNYQEVKFLPLAHFPSGRILLLSAA